MITETSYLKKKILILLMAICDIPGRPGAYLFDRLGMASGTYLIVTSPLVVGFSVLLSD